MFRCQICGVEAKNEGKLIQDLHLTLWYYVGVCSSCLQMLENCHLLAIMGQRLLLSHRRSVGTITENGNLNRPLKNSNRRKTTQTAQISRCKCKERRRRRILEEKLHRQRQQEVSKAAVKINKKRHLEEECCESFAGTVSKRSRIEGEEDEGALVQVYKSHNTDTQSEDLNYFLDPDINIWNILTKLVERLKSLEDAVYESDGENRDNTTQEDGDK